MTERVLTPEEVTEIFRWQHKGHYTVWEGDALLATVKAAWAERDHARAAVAQIADQAEQDDYEATSELVRARAEVERLTAQVKRLRKREPTEGEMVYALGGLTETFYDGWTIRRCLDCRTPVAGGPTRCVRCAERVEIARLRALLALARPAAEVMCDESELIAFRQALAAYSAAEGANRD